MQKRLFSWLAAGATVVGLLCGANGTQAKHYGSGVSTNSHGEINSCADFDFNFDDHKAVVAEEHFTVPKSASALAVIASRNGGVEAAGWSGNDYSITACKAAKDDSLLKEITVSAKDNRVTADGPGGGEWTVYLILKAPKDANVSIEAHNGPIGLRDLSGKIEAHSVNGPISVKDCSGDIRANTQNGPISMSGRGGTLNLETQNGPISVALAGNHWGTGKVSAHTQNGPLSLEVPHDYQSGVRVEMSGRSPVSCHAAQCGSASRTWDDENRYIEFGGSTPLIRMSTVNGPVSVDSQGSD